MNRLICCAIAFAAMSGCIGNDEGSDDGLAGPSEPTPGSSPSSQGVDLESCVATELLGPVDRDVVLPYAPQHFDVPENPLAAFGVMDCGVDVAQRGFFAFQVTPLHETLVSDRAVNHFWLADHFMQSGSTLYDAFAQHHAEVPLADISAAVDLQGVSISIVTEDVDLRWRGEGPIAAPLWTALAPNLDPFREYVPADGGYAYIDAGFGGDGPGGLSVGMLATSGPAVAADVYGASSIQPGLTALNLSYADAVVGFVPFPSE